MRFNVLLSIFVFSFSFNAWSANDEKSRVSFYLFDGGEPVAHATLSINDKKPKRSNKDGAIHLRLMPGQYNATLRFKNILQDINLSLQKYERSLFILYKQKADKSFNVEIESSHSAKRVLSISTQKSHKNSGKLGRLSGQVKSLETGVEISAARLYVSGLQEPLITDDEGRFSVLVPIGTRSLSVLHTDYSTQTLRDLDIEENKILVRDIELTPKAAELDEFVVEAPAIEGGYSALLDEQRSTSAVSEVIGADQMSQSGDSDAASALKRVTGLTVVDGKYIYVRGLGERYSSTTLNSVGMPSPDPTRKVVPLDLIPTGMIESIVIQKTFSPDMPGDFGGGTIQIRTKSIPDSKVRKISASLGWNGQSTFNDALSYDGGSTDYIGIDDGGRQFPGLLYSLTGGGSRSLNLLSDADREAAGESLPVNYELRRTKAAPDLGLKLNFADRFESYDDDWGWGYNFSLNFRNRTRLRDEFRASYGLGGRNNSRLVALDETNRQKSENEIDLGGVMNLSLEIGNNHSLNSTSMLTRKTTNTVIFDQSYLSENDIFTNDTTYEWVERQLFLQQFRGEHFFPRLNDMKVNWVGSYSQANRSEPDTRFFRYEKDEGGSFAFSDTNQSNQRSFEDLTDTVSSLGFDIELPIYDVFPRQVTLKAGFLSENKMRDSGILNFRFITDWSINTLGRDILNNSNPDNVLNADTIYQQGYILRNTTLPTDNYTASQSITASYLKADFNLSDNIKMMIGTRIERSEQEVSTFRLDSPETKETDALKNTDLMPALSLMWKYSDKQQIRLAYSQTVNRPDFKELSKAPYLDPESRDVVIGNPGLKRALITNYDLRWEWYLTKFETMSVAGFYKSFQDPIERVIRLGAGGVREFDNAENAENYGVEFQSRFWLSRLFGNSFSKFYMESNLSLIESNVLLGDSGAQQTTNNRPLQGQSPWIVNFTFAYEDLMTNTKSALLFNMFGERIVSVGVSGLPDAYEQPFPQLDYVFSRRVYEGNEDNLKLKFKIKNILDSRYEVLRGDEVEKSYNKGVLAKLSLEYKWK